MLTRDKVLSRAVDECLKDLYSYVEPKVEWETFLEECKTYSNKYKAWEEFHKAYNNREKNPKEWIKFQSIYSQWEGKSVVECIGPRPYEFYYIPRKILKSICDNYIRVFRIDVQQEFLDTIEILKHYCKEPIVDKYIEGELREDGTRWPGHKGYDHPNNLEKELYKLLREKAGFSVTDEAIENLSKEVQNKFFEFLDMAGNFYNWNRDLNTFNMNVYLGLSPNSNKETVIENWKKYRNQDISIDEEQMIKDYYGDED